MKKKNIIIAAAVSATIVGAGGAYYGYTYYNDPVLKIAKAEVETLEKISEYTNERLKEDISWFDKNSGKEKSLTINSKIENTTNVQVDMYQNPKANKGYISANISNPENPSQKIDLSFYDKDNDNIVADSNFSDYSLSIPETFIKEQLKYPISMSPVPNSIDTSYIDSLDISVNEITKIFIPDKNNQDLKLDNNDMIEILKTIPKEAVTKNDKTYTVTLNKERIDNLFSKYEEIATKKTKSEFTKNYIKDVVKNIKNETSKIKEDIKIDYKIDKDEVTRTISYKDTTIGNKQTETQTEIKSNVSKEKLSLSMKNVNNPNESLQYVSEKSGDSTYKDTVTFNGEQNITFDTRKSGNSTITSMKMINSTVDTMTLKTTVTDSTLTYELLNAGTPVVTLTYNNNPTKPAESSKEIKDLAGKSSNEQNMMLSEFVQKIMIKMIEENMDDMDLE